MNIIDKKKDLLYMKLRGQILREYHDKPYYSSLPGERELCEMYQVSRPTVRKALEILEEEKQIVRLSGKGSFFIGNKVIDTQVEEKTNKSVYTFYNQVRQRGDYTSSKVLMQKVILADAKVASYLKINEGEQVFRLERLRYINGKLYLHACDYVPCQVCPELDQYDFSDISLHNTLKQYGHLAVRGQRTIEIVKAPLEISHHLQLKENAPVALSKTTTYDQHDGILEYSITYSDAYNTMIELALHNDVSEE